MKKSEKVFALIDCNNFFVSCERVFNPGLRNKPVIVMSSNDGCAVARSNEVKKLGVPMGIPMFKIKEIIRANDIKLLSANFSLYADMSNRVMNILMQFASDVEIYSIDEAFVNLAGIRADDLSNYCKKIRETILKWTDIPVSIGIGSTKTLAKAASEIAKNSNSGVVNLISLPEVEIDSYLKKMSTKDVWGIGWKTAEVLKSRGVLSAYDFKKMDRSIVKEKMGVLGSRTQLELEGISCISLNLAPANNKSIISSRSFGTPVKTLPKLEEAVSSYTAQAARKLRAQKLVAANIGVYIVTNRFHSKSGYYSNHIVKKLDYPSSHTPEFTRVASEALREIYKPGYSYKKAGVYLLGLHTMDKTQFKLFDHYSFKMNNENNKLMDVVDRINRKWGTGVVKLSAEGINQSWREKREKSSPRYTTVWEEIPIAN